MDMAMNSSSRTKRDSIGHGNFDEVLDKVGGDGRHQKLLLYAFLVPLAFYIPFGSSSMLLMMSTPDHHCRVPARTLVNVSRPLWRRITIPRERGLDGRRRYSRCLMRNISFPVDPETDLVHVAIDPTTNISCKYGWDYDISNWHETATTHFNWVCHDSHIVTILFSVAIAGNAFGTFIVSMLADRYGRRPLFFVCVGVSAVFGVANLYVRSWQAFAATKFISSLAYFAMYQLPYLIVVEQSSERLRVHAAAASAVSITCGLCCMSLLAWLTKHWRTFGLICYLPGFLFFLYWRLLPESPRWLLSQGRTRDCADGLRVAAHRNGKSDTGNLEVLLQQAQQEEGAPAGLLDLLKSSVLRKRIIIVSMKSAILCVVYSGIIYNIRNMTGNEFVNFFALSLVEVPGNLLGMFSARFLGRRITTVYTQCVAAGFCFCAAVATKNQLALTVLCSLGKLFLTGAVVVAYMQVGELFPTPLRSAAYGVTGVIGLGATVAMPTLMALGEQNPQLPYYILACLCLVGGCISSLLPETLGRVLPQNVAEAASIGSGRSLCSCVHHWKCCNKHSNHPNRARGVTSMNSVSCDDGTTKSFMSSFLRRPTS